MLDHPELVHQPRCRPRPSPENGPADQRGPHASRYGSSSSSALARPSREPASARRRAERPRLDLLDRRVLQPARGRQLAHRGRHGAAELAVEVPLHHPPGRLPDLAQGGAVQLAAAPALVQRVELTH